MKQRSEMIADGFKTHGIHHQKSKTRYQWLRKKSHYLWGPQDLLSHTFKQFITFYLNKQKEDAYSGGAARKIACELKNLIQV